MMANRYNRQQRMNYLRRVGYSKEHVLRIVKIKFSR